MVGKRIQEITVVRWDDTEPIRAIVRYDDNTHRGFFISETQYEALALAVLRTVFRGDGRTLPFTVGRLGWVWRRGGV